MSLQPGPVTVFVNNPNGMTNSTWTPVKKANDQELIEATGATKVPIIFLDFEKFDSGGIFLLTQPWKIQANTISNDNSASRFTFCSSDGNKCDLDNENPSNFPGKILLVTALDGSEFENNTSTELHFHHKTGSDPKDEKLVSISLYLDANSTYKTLICNKNKGSCAVGIGIPER